MHPSARNAVAAATVGLTSLLIDACTSNTSTSLGDDDTGTHASADSGVDSGVTSPTTDAATSTGDSATPTPTSGADSGPATTVTTTRHTISLRTLDTSQFVTATGGGGSSLMATSATVGPAETFALTDLNGGTVMDGDLVQLSVESGEYWTAASGGGAGLSATATTASDDATFVVTRITGSGPIASGDTIALKTKLNVNYVSAIDGGGADVEANAPWDRAWETFTVTLDGVTPVPTPGVTARAEVLAYLAGIQGSKTVAGQHNKFNTTPSISTDWITTNTGKTPALWSADFGFGSDSVDARGTMIAEAIAQWRSGAIVQLMYHNCIPTGDELCDWDDIGGATPQHLTDSQWSDLVTDGTDLNNAWKARLDTLSVFFAQLKAAGVAPLFRPLHEMNQPIFWWAGRPGANGTAKLYQITHDYLVNTKGFDNILWVWDVQDFSTLVDDLTAYTPGDTYYDLGALDVYDGGYDSWKHDAMRAAVVGKPIAIGECETPPTSAELTSQPDWVFFMLWPDFLDQNAATLPALYNASNVVTESDMPGWK